MRIRTILLSLALGVAAASCGGNVCDEVGDKVQSCYADPACDASTTCAAAKANQGSGGEGVACEGAAKALVEACDQSTITPANNCSCSLN